MSKKKKKYFPNNWKRWKDTPPEFFQNYLPTFEEFMEWKIGGYEIPSSVDCIIREENLVTGLITEHVYERQSAANNKIKNMIESGTSEFCLASQDSVQHLYPKQIGEDYEDGEYDVKIP